MKVTLYSCVYTVFPSVELIRAGSQCAELELVVGVVVCVCRRVELLRREFGIVWVFPQIECHKKVIDGKTVIKTNQ